MHFVYQFVPFGTSFPAGQSLAEDQIVTDVGGHCLGYADEDRLLLDHHLQREGNFPSASAAVLHLAPEIKKRLAGARTVTLTTHAQPDFDAFCSLYLVRRLLEGALPDQGWAGQGLAPWAWESVAPGGSKIDWFAPQVEGIPAPYRWPILLAATASRVDHGKSLACPLAQALPAILYAGKRCGRDWLADGAYAFFRDTEERIREGRNPLEEALWTKESAYAPELILLENDAERYRADIARASLEVVQLPVAHRPFAEWFTEGLQKQPLWETAGLAREGRILQPSHRCQEHGRKAIDGVFLRDPASALFKEWARMDQAHSVMGQGFAFTAVAYSGAMAQGAVGGNSRATPGPGQNGEQAPAGPDRPNRSRYIFAINPEWCPGAHLYPAWAYLQAAEIDRRRGQPEAEPRPGFVERLGLAPGADDPWFDGNNYQCTIIDTPGKGTSLREGTLPGLEDDEPAEILRTTLRS